VVAIPIQVVGEPVDLGGSHLAHAIDGGLSQDNSLVALAQRGVLDAKVPEQVIPVKTSSPSSKVKPAIHSFCSMMPSPNARKAAPLRENTRGGSAFSRKMGAVKGYRPAT
jgi:hypothetical protein